MQLLESPTIDLTREGFILTLAKEVGHNLTNEEVLVMDLPCPTMRLCRQSRGSEGETTGCFLQKITSIIKSIFLPSMIWSEKKIGGFSKVEVKKKKMDEDEGIDWYKMKDTPPQYWTHKIGLEWMSYMWIFWIGEDAMQLRREVSWFLLVLWKPVQGELRVIDVGVIYPSRRCSEIGCIIFHHD